MGRECILLRGRIQRNHRKRTSNQHIIRLLFLSLRRSLGHLQGNLHTGSARRIGDLAAELEIADFHQRVLDCDSVHGGRDGCDGVAGVFVGDHTGESVEIHYEGTEAVLLVYKDQGKIDIRGLVGTGYAPTSSNSYPTAIYPELMAESTHYQYTTSKNTTITPTTMG